MLYFSIQNRLHDGTGKVSEAAGARWRFYPRIMFGLCSDYVRNVVESSFYWRKQLTEFPLKSWTYSSIWWGWRLTVLAPRIVNDVSYVTRINDEIHFAWQAQYLVRFEVDFACSAHSKWRFICDADQSWDAFCVAGAVFGEVGAWLFVAGAAFGDILGDGQSAKCCIFQYKIVSTMGRVRSPKRRVRDDDFILGLCSDYVSIGGSNSRSFCWNLELTDFVAGAVFGEVGGWLCLLRAL